MCGICGIVHPTEKQVDRDVLSRMNDAMYHRGPDGAGLLVDRNVGLGHRRLSIIDLSGGDQPIYNEDGSIAVVFNGEIYNYQELTRDLQARGHRFRTHSDTETLVHLYEDLGSGMFDRLRGMFALAIYDRNKGEVLLARDRFGMKPLYYHERNGTLYFASEIRPLIRAGYSVEVNQQGIHLYLQSRFAHGDETLFRGVYRLPEGSFLRRTTSGSTIESYYNPPHRASDERDWDYQSAFEEAFSDAVSSHMVADVPVGAYLSGGVDSSILVSEMVRQKGSGVRTFCVDIDDGASEASAAEQTAKFLGCEHTTVRCGVNELLELPQVVRSLEEPVGDAVVVAQNCLARATRAAGVKTVVTGDGADETLGGYQYLRTIITAAQWSRRLPGFAFSPLGQTVARLLPLKLIDRMAGIPLDMTLEAKERLVLLLKDLSKSDIRHMYDQLLSLFRSDQLSRLYSPEFRRQADGFAYESLAGAASGKTLSDQVLSMQFRKWLPANINMKQDRLSMAHSVENRVPFLDHRFVELAARLPQRQKIYGRESKVILRRLAAGRIPADVCSAKKKPFHLPLQSYLRDPRVRDLVRENLQPERLRRRGIVSAEYVARMQEGINGSYMDTKRLMALVILELWFRTFVDGESL